MNQQTKDQINDLVGKYNDDSAYDVGTDLEDLKERLESIDCYQTDVIDLLRQLAQQDDEDTKLLEQLKEGVLERDEIIKELKEKITEPEEQDTTEELKEYMNKVSDDIKEMARVFGTETTAPTTAKEMLNVLDEFLCRHDRESEMIVSVLSALRGPDDRSIDLKSSTTEVIRSAAFPMLALNAIDPRSDGGGCWHMARYDKKCSTPFDGGHFANHIEIAMRALQVLGLLTADGRLPRFAVKEAEAEE